MTPPNRETVAAVAPYALWMALLFGLEATAANYAWRTGLTLAALAAALCLGRAMRRPWWRGAGRGLGWGVLVGLVVCALWILPESIPWYRDFSLLGAIGLGGGAGAAEPSPYEPSVCGWALTWVKLFGSAFVIAPVEEFFFRSFLYRWLQQARWTEVDPARFDLSAFLWMVGLFALEHHTRLAAGAMAGAFYGLVAIRQGIGAAVVAHVVTNLLLGLYVIHTGQWGFW